MALIEATVDGVKFRYDPEAGKLWRWLTHQGRSKLKEPKWRETGLSRSRDGYPLTGIGSRKIVYVHRLVWRMVHGGWPGEIDHKNRDPGDFRLCNLAEVTHVQNQRNMSRRSDNTSGVTGVYWVKDRSLWRAHITILGELRVLGDFPSKADAAAARKKAEGEYGFSPSHGL